MIIVSPVAGRFSDKIGSRILTSAGFLLIGLSLLLLSSINANSSILYLVLTLAIMGIGSGLFESPNNSLIMASVPAIKRGTSSAMLATSRGLGMTIGLAISSSIYAARKAQYLTQGTTAATAAIGGFQDALIIVAYICIAGVIINLLAGNTKSKKIY